MAAVEGVAVAAPIGGFTFTAETGPTASVDSTVFGYELGGPGAPTTLSEGRLPSADGEAVASAADAEDGFAIGDVVTIVPGGAHIEIVGLADDANFNVQPTMFVSYATYEHLVRSSNPAARAVFPSLVGVEPEPGVSPAALAADITAAVDGVEALDRQAAVDGIPGVSSIRQSFAIILGLAFVVVALLTGFFFLILTVQKTTALTLLRAVGASSGYLLRNLALQVVSVILAGVAIAVALLLVAAGPASSGSFEVTVDPSVVAITTAALLLLGLVAAVGSMRRVAKLDPRPRPQPGRRGVGSHEARVARVDPPAGSVRDGRWRPDPDRGALAGPRGHPRRPGRILDRCAARAIRSAHRVQSRESRLVEPFAHQRGAARRHRRDDRRRDRHGVRGGTAPGVRPRIRRASGCGPLRLRGREPPRPRAARDGDRPWRIDRSSTTGSRWGSAWSSGVRARRSR